MTLLKTKPAMKSQFSEEKTKPFRLVKYFTFSSLVVIFLGTITLSVLNTHWARTMQRKKSEDYAIVVVENLNHQIFTQFAIPILLEFGEIQLRKKEQFERMDKVVKNALHSFKVNMVNIYDFKHITSYSFDKTRIGNQGSGGAGYQNAISGKLSSKLVQQGNFFQILLGFPPQSRLMTFAPLRAERPLSPISGPVLGVVEIVQDLSEDYKEIFRFQVRVIVTCSLVMSALFLVLLVVVKRGENIFEKRTQERLELKEQLSQAERLSSLGEMAAVISHEIRNPLGIIRSSAELLKKKMARLDPDNAIPDIIVEESNRLNNIITDFFNFAKPRDLKLSPCRIETIIEKNILFLETQINAQGYLIRKRIPADLPEITADPDMLYQAFLNLLLNAVQSMPGGGDVTVEVNSNKEHIIITFDDNGEGIPENNLKKIWDPFFTTKEKGTGLGLGIVTNIIEAHGGTLQIQNRVDKGVRVTVQLPVKPNRGI
ncbi:MAG: ATP-binding protein [Desulfobacterales bacterium]|nr:ATP-binding protein [Desulfobacterales bacterium]